MKYCKRLEIVDAELWIGHDYSTTSKVVRPLLYSRQPLNQYGVRAQEIIDTMKCQKCDIKFADHGEVTAHDGVILVCPNSWIVTDDQGNKEVLTPAKFLATYEPLR